MGQRTSPRTLVGGLAVGTLLLLSGGRVSSCWNMIDPLALANRAPIIVLGEIVSIDEASAQTKERDTLRYLDGAHILVEKVYKNALSDVAVVEKSQLTAYMHSKNMAVPGSEKNGQRVMHCVSTDLRYATGTRGVWFLFLGEDGQFYVNRHPQQLQRRGKGDKEPTVPLGAVGEQFSKAQWAKRLKAGADVKATAR